MKNILTCTVFLTVVFLLSHAATAAEPSDSLDAKAKTEIITSLGIQLNKNYVFPDVAGKVAAQLAKKNGHHGYDSATTREAFADQLSKDLRDMGNDLHFHVSVIADFKPYKADSSAPTKEENDKARKFEEENAYGIVRVERLQGNVGYIELTGFGMTEFVAKAYASALSLLMGTDAMIIDFRRNGGGSPSSVAYFMSYFFIEGDERHLNDLYFRPDNTTREYWTNPVEGDRYIKPVYVLTSNRTFSGAEECAYDFQTQGRAVLIGETTGGGANPGGAFALGHDLVAFISTGKAVNPITHTNWEHVGVKPDIAVPAEQAFYTAYAKALQSLLPTATSPRAKQRIEDALSHAGKNEPMPVNYARPF